MHVNMKEFCFGVIAISHILLKSNSITNLLLRIIKSKKFISKNYLISYPNIFLLNYYTLNQFIYLLILIYFKSSKKIFNRRNS